MSWQLRAKAELEKRRRQEAAILETPADWRTWLETLFPTHVWGGFAHRHAELWEWVWSIERGISPRPFVAIWPRKAGKSTSAELAAVAIGARDIRPYVWYVRETQDQADGSVTNIMDLLESASIEKYHPRMAERELGKYGRPRAWRRQQIRTASGLTIDAIGLDTARRGAKVKENRPGFIILDDIDGKHDGLKKTRKKIEIITTSLLPAGAQDVAVLAIQNLIIPNGVFAKLAGIADEQADFLANRIVSGPYPAVEGLEVEQREGQFRIIGGTPTWEGQDLTVCQSNIDLWGYTAFLQEAQHEVDAPLGGIWDHVEFQRVDWADVPDMVRGAVWVDPAVTSTDQSDAMGIQADGVAEDGKIYRFFSWEQVTTPEDAIRRAILKALELGFTTVGVETDQGGDTWRSVYGLVWGKLLGSGDLDRFFTEGPSGEKIPPVQPGFRSAKAGAGHGSKVERNQRMLAHYERGNVIHVRGTHKALERALKRFPLTKPFDLVDAAYWAWWDVSGQGGIWFA